LPQQEKSKNKKIKGEIELALQGYA
jgi:hypothetical protein